MAQSTNPAFTDTASASESVSAFWSWWTARLGECVPSSAAAWFQGREQTTVLEWESEGFSVKRVDAGGTVATALMRTPLDVAKIEKVDDILPALKQISSRVRGPIALAVGEGRVLRKHLTFPIMARENLRQTIAYDVDRLTPFPSGTVAFDAVESSVDYARRTVTADFVATPKQELDVILAAAQRAGLNVTRVVPSAKDAAGGLNMIRAAVAEEAKPWWQSPHLWGAAATAALLAAVLAFPLWQKRQQVLEAQPIAAQAERDAADADKLLREINLRLNQYNFLPAKRHTTPLAIQVLDEVTKVLPDDGWVQNFDLKTTRAANATSGGQTTYTVTRELQLQGEIEASSKLIPLFEKSPLFSQPQFKSPLTKLNYPGQNVNGDRFHVAMEVKTGSLPAVVPVQAVITAPPPPPPAATTAAPAGAPAAAKAGAPAASAPATPSASSSGATPGPAGTEAKK